jgi:kynurenine formamidase
MLLAESLGGDLSKLSNQRAWFMINPLPFMEVEAAWSRVAALQAPEGVSDSDFYDTMASIDLLDMTLPFSVQTPQWANYEPLSITYTKRVGGQDLGLGRNNAHCKASFHLATHMDGEKHFWAAGRTIGQVPFDHWHGPGVVVDIADAVSDSSVYTPQMIEDRVDLHDGDILLIKAGWHKYGWNSPDSDEFRYMIQHPGPSPEFADWCVERQIKWIGIDCVAMEHPMNTIQRIFHPGQFAVAEEKIKAQYDGKSWDEVFPQDKYYQDMHLNLFPKGIVHAENLGTDIARAETGRYYIAAFIPRGMELASCWGRFLAFRES